jgi:hypothetical protein
MKTQALTLLIVLLGTAGAARADRYDGSTGARDDHDRFRDRKPTTLHAPEIDPASMVVALTLLTGGVAVLRGRRAMKPGR